MSVLALFKQHVSKQYEHAHSWWHQRNQLAEFYSGFYGRAMGVHIGHELKECMGSDDEALFMWGKALEHLSRDERDEFKEASGKAKELSEPLFANCHTNGKFTIVENEMGQWFYDFWTQPDAIEIMMENIERHPIKVKLDVLAMRLSWALGLYHQAGTSYGRFWRHLMGEPGWNANLNSDKMRPQKKIDQESAAAILQANGLKVLTGDDFVKDIQECVLPDPVEYEVYDAMFDQLVKDMGDAEHKNFDKYLRATFTMDKYNWKPCESNKELMASMGKYLKQSDEFWKQDGVDKIVEKNIKAKGDDFTAQIVALKKHWAEGNFDQAGEAYGQFWGMMMGLM